MAGCVANFRRNSRKLACSVRTVACGENWARGGAPVAGIGDGVGAALRRATLGLGVIGVAGWRFIETADVHFRPSDRATGPKFAARRIRRPEIRGAAAA